MKEKKKTSVGKCENCGQTFDKKAISKHIEKCCLENPTATAATDSAANVKMFHLLVEARGGPMYWLHIDIPASATLKTLDGFLREIWLECCGHLSLFDIEGTEYFSSPDRSMRDRSMAVTLEKVLYPGMKFSHEYDFGSTTELVLKVVSEHSGATLKKGVRLLARNEPIEIPCDICGKPSVQICSECAWDDKGWLCSSCAEQHDCDEDMFLPVVNSPRVGVCGYCG